MPHLVPALVLLAIVGIWVTNVLGRRRAARSFGRDALEVPGTITDNWRNEDAETGGVRYHPWVQFTTHSGEVKQIMMLKGEASPREIGSIVAVLYNKRNPDDALVKGTRPPLSGPRRLAAVAAVAAGLFLLVTVEDWWMHDKLVSDRTHVTELLRMCSVQILAARRSAVRTTAQEPLRTSLRRNVANITRQYCSGEDDGLASIASGYIYGASFKQVCGVCRNVETCTGILDSYTRSGWPLPVDFEPTFDVLLRKLQIPENLIPFEPQ